MSTPARPQFCCVMTPNIASASRSETASSTRRRARPRSKSRASGGDRRAACAISGAFTPGSRACAQARVTQGGFPMRALIALAVPALAGLVLMTPSAAAPLSLARPGIAPAGTQVQYGYGERREEYRERRDYDRDRWRDDTGGNGATAIATIGAAARGAARSAGCTRRRAAATDT